MRRVLNRRLVHRRGIAPQCVWLLRAAIPGGGMVSTAEDLARFAIAAQNGVLIKRETFEQMTQNQKTRDGRETGYGYGWFIGSGNPDKPDDAIWPGGVQPGCTTALRLWSKKRLAIVILTNLEGGGRLGLGGMADELAEIVSP